MRTTRLSGEDVGARRAEEPGHDWAVWMKGLHLETKALKVTLNTQGVQKVERRKSGKAVVQKESADTQEYEPSS